MKGKECSHQGGGEGEQQDEALDVCACLLLSNPATNPRRVFQTYTYAFLYFIVYAFHKIVGGYGFGGG